jgi:hypothetical protein
MPKAHDDQELATAGAAQVAHEHVAVAVTDATRRGVEYVPARHMDGSAWQLLRSPLYARHVAAGDVIQVTAPETGEFEVLTRGVNICVHFYLADTDADSASTTSRVVESLAASLGSLGGRIEASTPGLVAATVPATAGFAAIEEVLEQAVRTVPGAQWEYTNVYDPNTGEPMRWWE